MKTVRTGALILLLIMMAVFLNSCLILDVVKDRYKPYRFVGEDGDKVLVEFVFDSASARTVWLAGSFNSWASDKNKPAYPAVTLSEGARIPMTVDAKTGYWVVTVPLSPGRYQYKYVLDEGTLWAEDPNTPEHVPDGFGGNNSVIVVVSQSSDKKK